MGKELSNLLNTTLENKPVIFACDFNKSWDSDPVNDFRERHPYMTSAYDASDKTKVSSKKLRKAGEQTNKIGERIEHTIDYIFASPHFTKTAHLELPTVEEVKRVTGENGLPCWKFPSDHFNLVADFEFNDYSPKRRARRDSDPGQSNTRPNRSQRSSAPGRPITFARNGRRDAPNAMQRSRRRLLPNQAMHDLLELCRAHGFEN